MNVENKSGQINSNCHERREPFAAIVKKVNLIILNVLKQIK